MNRASRALPCRRNETKLKYRFYVICLSFAFFAFVGWTQEWHTRVLDRVYSNSEVIAKVQGIKYVLQWTYPDTELFFYMRKGQDVFIARNCSKRNCYITSHRRLLQSVTEFDTILFHGPDIVSSFPMMPWDRTPNQSYVYVSMESSSNYPALDNRYNGFFNFTWTYKLNSDINYGYITIRNEIGEVIGPKKDISWINKDDMLPITDDVKLKLDDKKIAAAWFVSNCETINKRLELAYEIKKELERHNMALDIYGKCGTMSCPRDSMAECLNRLRRDYYFYLAFENSMSEDYVTEKLLHALQNYAVPVVYGGADYRRFMPDGIYLNAAELSVKDMVHQMVTIINDTILHESYFKWHNHYSYHRSEESPDTDPYCQFCDFINGEKRSTIDNFKEWWNGN